MEDEGSLGRLDRPPIEDAELPEDLKRWLTNVVDIVNEALRNIELLLP